jgi:hypothetical protein
MTIEELKRLIHGASLDDLLVPGYLDQDDAPVRFRALPLCLYVELGAVLLELATVETTGTLRLRAVQAIRRLPELDDDMVFAVASLRQQVLRDVDAENRIAALKLWRAEDADDAEGGIGCGAAAFELENGQEIFIDPTNHFGIRVGGSELREAWLRDWPGAEGAAENVLALR